MCLCCASHPNLTCSFSLGLFAVPTRIVFIVAPINVLLNYLLGMFPSLLPCPSHLLSTQYGVLDSVSASSVPPSQPPSLSTSSPLCLLYTVYSTRPLKHGIPSPAACLPVWAFWSSWALVELVRTLFPEQARALIQSPLNRPNGIGMVGLGIDLPRCFSVCLPSLLFLRIS